MNPDTPQLTPGTIARYLAGSRAAILAIARTQWSLAVGAILVLAGGLARNYDGAYFATEWPVLTHGLAVSTLNALVLFVLVYAAAKGRSAGIPFWRGYLSFLGLFWMTAPMAWLYGIPYERFLAPVDALHANMWTLAFVSVWRVVLISRALAVIFNERTRRVIWITMAFADAALLGALWLAPLPVIDFMGGMQQSPLDRELAGAAFTAGFFGVVTFPVWLIGAAVAAARMKGSWAVGGSWPRRAPRAALAFAALALAAWGAAAWSVQGEQRLRVESETLLRAGDIDGAMRRMSAHRRADYPPLWDPPPRPAWRIFEPSVDKVRAVLAANRYEPWVEDLFWDKCWRDLRRGGFFAWTPVGEWAAYTRPDWPPPEWWAAAQIHSSSDSHLSADDRADLNAAIRAHTTPDPAAKPPMAP